MIEPIDTSIRYFLWSMFLVISLGAIAGIGFSFVESSTFIEAIQGAFPYALSGGVLCGIVGFFVTLPVFLLQLLLSTTPLIKDTTAIYISSILGIALVDILFLIELLTSTRADYAQIIDLITYNYKYILVAIPVVTTIALSLATYMVLKTYQADLQKLKRKNTIS